MLDRLSPLVPPISTGASSPAGMSVAIGQGLCPGRRDRRRLRRHCRPALTDRASISIRGRPGPDRRRDDRDDSRQGPALRRRHVPRHRLPAIAFRLSAIEVARFAARRCRAALPPPPKMGKLGDTPSPPRMGCAPANPAMGGQAGQTPSCHGTDSKQKVGHQPGRGRLVPVLEAVLCGKRKFTALL